MIADVLALLMTTSGGFASPAIEDCAAHASHPDDPDRIAPGREREEIDLPLAVAACRTATSEQPFDPRSAYHLGRVLYYSGAKPEAMRWLEASAESGYRQSIFVIGYVISLGEAPRTELCRAAALWTRAASVGHPWSAYHLVEKTLDGKLAGCPAEPAAPHLGKYIELARSQITVSASAGRVEALSARLENHIDTGKALP